MPSKTVKKKSNETSKHKIQALVKILFSLNSMQDASLLKLLKSFQTQYMKLKPEEAKLLFDAILRDMEIKKVDIEDDLHELLKTDSNDAVKWGQSLTGLRHKLESPRTLAFRQFINIPGGLKFLLDFRADLLALRRQSRLIDADIAQLFNTWFQQGSLSLLEITRDSSYRHIQFLKEHDMVHPMTSIEEMGNRLGLDHRCFALFHHAMPDEIIIFIELALSKGIIKSINEIIHSEDQQSAPVKNPDTAIFYSINSSQNGLAGLGLGKFLIFQAVEAIKRDHPSIKTFATLSPIPGLWERYLAPILKGDDERFAMKKKYFENMFSAKCKSSIMAHYAELNSSAGKNFALTLATVLSDPAWIKDEVYLKLLKKPLTEAAYFHVAKEVKSHGKMLNPVANFHLSNGANVELRNINFAANRSERGTRDSCGLMVNYIYSEDLLQQIKRTMKSLLPWQKD